MNNKLNQFKSFNQLQNNKITQKILTIKRKKLLKNKKLLLKTKVVKLNKIQNKILFKTIINNKLFNKIIIRLRQIYKKRNYNKNKQLSFKIKLKILKT